MLARLSLVPLVTHSPHSPCFLPWSLATARQEAFFSPSALLFTESLRIPSPFCCPWCP